MISVVFAGSPAPAARTLEILFSHEPADGYKIAGVLTNPPSTQGRHKTLISTPVQVVAASHDVPVFTPEHLDAQCREQIAAVHPDLLVCFAYGHIFGPKFLALFPLGGINLHPSLLPKYRGCTPVNAAILNRDTETAVTVQRITLAMDEGNILAQEKVVLTGTEIAGTLLMYSAEHGAELIRKILADTARTGTLADGTPQQGEPSYTGMLTKESGRIDWNKPACDIDAQIRAYTPEPGSWTTENGVPLRIIAAHAADDDVPASAAPGTVLSFEKTDGIRIATGSGVLAVSELQRQGKTALSARDFINGARGFVGSVLQ